MRTILLFIALPCFVFQNDSVLGQSTEAPTVTFVRSPRPSTTVRIEYHKFLLLKQGSDIIAVHAMPDPRFGWGGINYRWYRLTNASDECFLPSPESSDSSENQHVETGTGNTDDHDGGSGSIKMGGLEVEWSKSNHEAGWIYLHHVDDGVQIYPTQFDRIQDFSGKLRPELWKTIKQLKSEDNENRLRSVNLRDGEMIIDGHVIPIKK